MKTCNIVLVGCGAMGKNHLRVLNENSNFNLIAIVDPCMEANQQLTNVSIYSTIEEIPLEKEYQAAIVASPSYTHFEITKKLLKADKHVLVEKPMCIDTLQSKRLVGLAEKSRGKLLVGHLERCNPAVIKLNKVLQSNLIGKPIHFDFTRVGGYPKIERDYSNVLLDLAVHDIDIFNMLVGNPRLKSSILHSAYNKDVVDTAEILLIGNQNISASIHVNWITPTKIRTLRVTGVNGICIIDYILQTCRVIQGNKPTEKDESSIQFEDLVLAYKNKNWAELPVEEEEPLKIQLREFHKALNHRINFCCSPEEAMLTIDIASRAFNMR